MNKFISRQFINNALDILEYALEVISDYKDESEDFIDKDLMDYSLEEINKYIPKESREGVLYVRDIINGKTPKYNIDNSNKYTSKIELIRSMKDFDF